MFRVVQGASVTDFTMVHVTPLNSVRAEGGRERGRSLGMFGTQVSCVCFSGRACQTSATSLQAPGFFEVFQFGSCLRHRVLEILVFFVRRVMFVARLLLLPAADTSSSIAACASSHRQRLWSGMAGDDVVLYITRYVVSAGIFDTAGTESWRVSLALSSGQ